MDRRSAVVLGVIFGGLFLALFGFLVLAIVVAGSDGGPRYGRGNVGVVEVEGPITDGERAVRALHRFLKDDGIKAVVVRVDSPGGAVGASQAIHAEVKHLADEKIVVVSMGNVAASGGYYLSAAATRIVANPGTVTGSIGVITELPNVTALADKVGFRMNVVKSGPAKDIGNPFRPFTEADRTVFQGLIGGVYEQFVDAVAEGRNLPEDRVRAVADGRVLTGEQAQKLGLVDDLGNFNDAVRIAASLAGVRGEPKLVYPPEDRPLDLRHLLAGSVREAVRAAASEVRVQLGGGAGSGGLQYRLPGF